MKMSYKQRYIDALKELEKDFAKKDYKHRWVVDVCKPCVISKYNCAVCPINTRSPFTYGCNHLSGIDQLSRRSNKEICCILKETISTFKLLPVKYFTPSGYSGRVFQRVFEQIIERKNE